MDNPGVKNLIDLAADSNTGITFASGLSEGHTAYAAAQIIKKTQGQLLIAASSYEKAKKLEEYLTFFASDKKIYLLPDEERSLFAYDAKSRMLSHRRIDCLTAALAGEPAVFVAPVMAAVKGMCSPEVFRDAELKLEIGHDIENIDRVKSKLVEMGYERADMAEVKGQFRVRGEIIDIFPPNSEYPYRIDLFDTEIDDLKSFDPLTQ